jgi:hypothetical protein
MSFEQGGWREVVVLMPELTWVVMCVQDGGGCAVEGYAARVAGRV